MNEDLIETIDNEYLTGFNDGYFFAKNYPDIAEQIAKAKGNEGPRLMGFLDGRSEYLDERIKDLRPRFMFDDLENRKDEPDKNKGRDIEPDR